MRAVLGWLKSNVWFVVLSLVVFVAPAGAFVGSVILNTGLREGLEEPAKQAFSSVSNATVRYTVPAAPGLPEVSESAAPNTAMTAFVAEERARRAAATEAMIEAAKAYNRGGDEPHGVLLRELLPSPPSSSQGLRYEMASLVTPESVDGERSFYDDLFDELGFRGPADNERVARGVQADLEERLRRTGETSLSQLSEERRAGAIEQNVQRRYDLLLRHARDASMFAEVGLLAQVLPAAEPAEAPGIEECFEWQFDLWVIEEVLRSLRSLNDDAVAKAVGVPGAAVKRVLSLGIAPFEVECVEVLVPGPAAAPAQPASGGVGRGTPAEGRRGGGVVDRDSGGGAVSGFASPAARSPAGIGGGNSLTGRAAGPGDVFDVRIARVSLVVDSSRVPDVLAKLSSRNFVSVLDVDLGTVDVAADLEEGYAYGSQPVVRMDLELESVWLRAWTKEFMPDCVKQGLGIPLDVPGEAGAGPGGA